MQRRGVELFGWMEEVGVKRGNVGSEVVTLRWRGEELLRRAWFICVESDLIGLKEEKEGS